jgi:hypothetical protein
MYQTHLTHIRFNLDTPATISLIVYNSAGIKVQDLGNNSYSTGIHEIEFDGSLLNNGIYYYRLESNEFTDVKKMVVVH